MILGPMPGGFLRDNGLTKGVIKGLLEGFGTIGGLVSGGIKFVGTAIYLVLLNKAFGVNFASVDRHTMRSMNAVNSLYI